MAAGVAIVLGGLGGVVALLAGRGRKGAIPFGPYLAAGAVVAALWGEPIADWYLRTLDRLQHGARPPPAPVPKLPQQGV